MSDVTEIGGITKTKFSFRVVETAQGFRDLQYAGEEDIPADTVVYELTGPVSTQPTQTSIQIHDDGLHIQDRLGQFINHNCNPTMRIMGKKLISTCTIRTGDSITFDYNQSEDVMASPFFCNCCPGRGNWISGRRALAQKK